ncbi:hypothetical protein [Crocosphaera sp.]|uniref:hypothetical protein n=1 Tax=Crocosphaera sp. TaxID=2729996 RepID=UPI0026064975|nr:hypothetical protein [Crocosphaera sp.]MDJ0583284.1 hypothetical protein [Crocosphaera sp.]
MNIKPGDVITVGNQPGLVRAVRGKMVIIRRFRFTPTGQWRGCFDSQYKITQVSKATETQVNSVYSQAIQAVSFNRFSVPRKIFLMIVNGENNE